MEMPRNALKAALGEGRLQIGLWSSLCSPIVAEIIGGSGFDWILFDTEHSPNEVPDLLKQMQACANGTATAVVRPAWNDPVLIKRALDIGAQSILVPFVSNADEARRAVAACKYPPAGTRGITTSGRASHYGRVSNYFTQADEEICVLIQVETENALVELEAIAKTVGVDGIFIGPSDLAASMGYIGRSDHPTVQASIRSAGERLARAGKAAGILAFNEVDASRYIEWSYRFVAVGSDLGLLRQGADLLASRFRCTL